MNLFYKSLSIAVALICTSKIIASPKKRSFDDDEQPTQKQRLNNNQEDAMDLDEESPHTSNLPKHIHTTTRQEEENRLCEEYRQLVIARVALTQAEEWLNSQPTEYTTKEKQRLVTAFALHETKATQLRSEVHPAMDLKNKHWDKNLYWGLPLNTNTDQE